MQQKTSSPAFLDTKEPQGKSSSPVLVELAERLEEQRNKQANYIDRIASKVFTIKANSGDDIGAQPTEQRKPPEDFISAVRDLIERFEYQNDRLHFIANHLEGLI